LLAILAETNLASEKTISDDTPSLDLGYKRNLHGCPCIGVLLELSEIKNTTMPARRQRVGMGGVGVEGLRG